jgi:hypothetical protein
LNKGKARKKGKRMSEKEGRSKQSKSKYFPSKIFPPSKIHHTHFSGSRHEDDKRSFEINIIFS